ncbi:MAG: FAD-dependent oxidoreductase [Chloroflexia bacterium]|nr:FAD-dependent oxidoreductase [Chloroflexia bacterium]
MTARAAGTAPDIVIVGGGIIGCALAFDLAGYGMKVELLERRELAREASWASAGIISPPTPALGTRAELGLIGFRRYPELVAEVEGMTGIGTGFVQTGELMAWREADSAELREIQSWQAGAGLQTVWLDGSALREREPALRVEFASGLLTPETASIRLDRFTVALARAAVIRGATIREFSMAQGIAISGGRATGVQTFEGVRPAGAVVIAAGAWSASLSDSLDYTIATRPVRGQMMSIVNPPVRINSVIAAEGGYIVPRADGSVAVGATEEPDAGFDVRVTPAGIAWLVDLVDRVAPSLNLGTLESTWAGLRPGSDDGELIVGKVPHLDNVWVATGHFRSGALLGPATSQLLAAAIVANRVDERLAAFGPERFG